MLFLSYCSCMINCMHQPFQQDETSCKQLAAILIKGIFGLQFCPSTLLTITDTTILSLHHSLSETKVDSPFQCITSTSNFEVLPGNWCLQFILALTKKPFPAAKIQSGEESKVLTIKLKIMLNANDAAKVFETILSTPGMSEVVKVDFKISRKNALLLCSVIERGLSAKDEDKNNILELVPKEDLAHLVDFCNDCLQKAGLTELHQKLKSLNGK